MNNKMSQICNNYKFESVTLEGYSGGYPILRIKSSDKIEKIPDRKLKKILRNAEFSEGSKLGVGMNFYKTSYLKYEENDIVICGYISVIENVLVEICQK